MSFTRIGLDEFSPNSLMMVEEDIGDVKRIFVGMISYEAISSGRSVTYITPRLKEDVVAQMSLYDIKWNGNFNVIDKFRDCKSLAELCTGDVCIIESFTSAFIDSSLSVLVNTMNDLIDSSRQGRRIFLTVDSGIVPDAYHRIVRAKSDTVVQLVSSFTENRVNRYIYVPKMKDKAPPDKMVPYSIDELGTSIFIDLRERYA